MEDSGLPSILSFPLCFPVGILVPSLFVHFLSGFQFAERVFAVSLAKISDSTVADQANCITKHQYKGIVGMVLEKAVSVLII